MYRKSIARLFSLLISVAALGLFYSGEALAVCCKSLTGACGCTLSTSCATGTTPVSSCTLSGGGLSFKGSVISCVYGASQGNVSAIKGDASTGTPAEWTEYGRSVTCDSFPDTDNNGIADCAENGGVCTPNEPDQFELSVTYTMRGECVEDPDSGIGNNCVKFTDADNKGKRGGGGGGDTNVSQAVCNNATGVLRYEASCGPGVTVNGYLRYVGQNVNPPTWAKDGNGPYQLMLGGFRTDRKGNVDLAACANDFPDQTGAGGTLGTGKVLLYTEQYTPGTLCTQNLTAASGQRRMCHNNSFDPTSTNGPCAPEKVGGMTVTYAGGINPADTTTVDTIVLDVNQWTPNPTINVGCKNSGNVPTTLNDSATFKSAGVNDPTVRVYVKGTYMGDATDASPAQRWKTILDVNGNPIGKNYDFDGCRNTPKKDGLNQVICRHQALWNDDGTIDLTIRGELTSSSLEFSGDAVRVKLSGNCEAGTYELP